MIQVTVGTTTSRTKVVVEETKTPKDVLQEAEVDYSVATVHLDGAVLSTPEMNTSLDELGVDDSCMLIAVVKQENA